MPVIEARYQENGFLLALYRERGNDPNASCPECGRKLFHVATIYDEWSEGLASFTYYHYCKAEQLIVQRIIRTNDAPQPRTTTFHQPPYELLIELLATARQQNGRNVTELTLNRHWWTPRKYPLHLGTQLEVEENASARESAFLGDDSPAEMPISSYEPPATPPRNPFTSRGTPANANSSDDTSTDLQDVLDDEETELPPA